MPISYSGWGSSEAPDEQPCECLTMQHHWVKYTKKKWPDQCSVIGCMGKADVAGYINHPQIAAPVVVPMCIKCSVKPAPFNLRPTTSLALAIKKESCG